MEGITLSQLKGGFSSLYNFSNVLTVGNSAIIALMAHGYGIFLIHIVSSRIGDGDLKFVVLGFIGGRSEVTRNLLRQIIVIGLIFTLAINRIIVMESVSLGSRRDNHTALRSRCRKQFITSDVQSIFVNACTTNNNDIQNQILRTIVKTRLISTSSFGNQELILTRLPKVRSSQVNGHSVIQPNGMIVASLIGCNLSVRISQQSSDKRIARRRINDTVSGIDNSTICPRSFAFPFIAIGVNRKLKRFIREENIIRLRNVLINVHLHGCLRIIGVIANTGRILRRKRRDSGEAGQHRGGEEGGRDAAKVFA